MHLWPSCRGFVASLQTFGAPTPAARAGERASVSSPPSPPATSNWFAGLYGAELVISNATHRLYRGLLSLKTNFVGSTCYNCAPKQLSQAFCTKPIAAYTCVFRCSAMSRPITAMSSRSEMPDLASLSLAACCLCRHTTIASCCCCSCVN